MSRHNRAKRCFFSERREHRTCGLSVPRQHAGLRSSHVVALLGTKDRPFSATRIHANTQPRREEHDTPSRQLPGSLPRLPAACVAPPCLVPHSHGGVCVYVPNHACRRSAVAAARSPHGGVPLNNPAVVSYLGIFEAREGPIEKMKDPQFFLRPCGRKKYRVSHVASLLAPGSLARRRLARVIHHHHHAGEKRNRRRTKKKQNQS